MSTIAQAITTFIRENPDRVLNQGAFATAVEISEGRLSQILGGERASQKLAIRIHKFTNGKVPGSLLRPDLWRRPEDVPVPQPEAVQ